MKATNNQPLTVIEPLPLAQAALMALVRLEGGNSREVQFNSAIAAQLRASLNAANSATIADNYAALLAAVNRGDISGAQQLAAQIAA